MDLAVSAFPYDPLIKRLVLAAKNGGRRDLAAMLGERLAESLGAARVDDSVGRYLDLRPTVVWVPASRHGRRARGYDQARLLARSVARHLDLPLSPVLARVGGGSQTGRREERLHGPGIRCRLRHCPSPVLLVDDVMTTGASLEAAARVLRGSGVTAVMAATVAAADDRRAVRRP